MEPFVATLTIGATVLALVNFAKFIRAGVTGQGWNGAITMLLAFVIAFLALLLFRETVWGAQTVVGDHNLQDLEVLDLLVPALAASSVGSVIYDTLNSIDSSSSAKKPPLVGPKT
jgi:hypothetical protein